VEDDAVSRHLGRRADVVTARAVTRLEALVRWGRPLLREQGVRKLVAWKGGDLEAELLEARRNPTVQSIREIQIDLPEERMFVTEQKKLVEIRYR
jgi:16S rRNA G527 N7-methylase RsmG